MRIFILFSFFVLLISCTQNKERNLKGEEIDTEAYLRTKSITTKETHQGVDFRIIVNPYDWDSNAHLILYLNNTIVYSSRFERSGKLQISDLKPNQLVHFKMEIVKHNELFRFENKSVFNWDNNYKYIYIAFFPEKPTTENIYFFPQQSEIIQ